MIAVRSKSLCPPAGSEMSALGGLIDWSGTKLQAMHEWPACLRMTVSAALDSPLPTIVLWGPDLIQIYNAAYQMLLGSRHPVAMGQRTQECWPEVWHFNEPIYRRVMNTGEQIYLEDQEYSIHPSGVREMRYFTLNHAPARDEDGTVRGVLVVAIETTRRLLADRDNLHLRNAARLAADQFQQMFQQAPGFLALLKGPEHIFESTNAAYRELLGDRKLIGKSVRQAIPEAESQGFVKILDQVYRSGKPFLASERPVYLQGCKDAVRPERYLDFVYQPVKDPQGQVFGIFVSGSDVTEKHLAHLELASISQELDKIYRLEEETKRQTFRLQIADLLRRLVDPMEIFAQTSELVGRYLKVCRVVYGRYNSADQQITFHSNYTDGTVCALNGTYPSARFGVPNVESLLRGNTWVFSNAAQDPRTSSPDVWPTFQTLEVSSGVVVPLSRGGLFISSLCVMHREPRDWTDQDVRLLEDVAERIWNAVERARAEQNQRQAEEKLREADRRKDEFLAMLSHELRNPLAPISMAAHLLSRSRSDAAAVPAMSEIIVRQADHMSSLIEDLLDISRINNGLITLDLEPLDIKEIVVHAVEQVHALMEKRQHHFSMHIAAQAMRVAGDRVRLVQIFSNLLNNAAKYTPEGGELVLEVVATTDQQVRLTVRDNGVGISPRLLPHIFDIFTQAERSSDRLQGGLGLGLSLVKNLAELHGGRVTAMSSGAGTGSEFTVYLPLLPESSRAPDAPLRTPCAWVSQRSLLIMVVDDNIDAAKTVAMLLEMEGHTVSIEHSAEAALQSALAAPPQGFLLDIGLPGMDGYELARQLRATASCANALMIALTGYGQPQDREKSRQAGFDHHFDKPIDPAKLLALLARPGDALRP